VAVAGDGSGDQLVIDFGAPVPSVGWWRHDALEGEPKVVRVAASFSELLEKLCEPPDDL